MNNWKPTKIQEKMEPNNFYVITKVINKKYSSNKQVDSRKTIRIDDEVWAWLKGKAEPFEDTPNSVLRRIAGLDQGASERVISVDDSPGSAAARRVQVHKSQGEKLPQWRFREAILQVLTKRGGSATRVQALREVEKLLGDELTPFDRSDIRSGSVRWEKSAEWERHQMMREKLIKHDSPRGVWELTEAGREVARRVKSA